MLKPLAYLLKQVILEFQLRAGGPFASTLKSLTKFVMSIGLRMNFKFHF